MEKRGIVIQPSYSVDAQDGSLVGLPFLDEELLRYCVLYWDVIDCPIDDLFDRQPESTSDLTMLIEEGVFQQTRGRLFVKQLPTSKIKLSFDRERPAEFYCAASIYAVLKHLAQGEKWALGSRTPIIGFDVDKLFFVENTGDRLNPRVPGLLKIEKNDPGYLVQFESGPGLSVELNNALPTPGKDVPLEKILEFKQKNADELSRFRTALDKICLEIGENGNVEMAKDIAIRELKQNLSDIDKLLNERGIKRVFRSLKTDIMVSEVIKNTLLGGAAGSLIGGPINLAIGAAVAGLATVFDVKLSLNSVWPKKLPPHLRDYQYIYESKKKLR